MAKRRYFKHVTVHFPTSELYKKAYDYFLNLVKEHVTEDELQRYSTAKLFLKGIELIVNGNIEVNAESEPEEEIDNFSLPELPCVYASWHDKAKQLVDCARLLSKKGKLITLPFEACKKCYERRLAVKKRMMKAPAEEKMTEIRTSDLDLREDGTIRWYCPLKNTTHKLTKKEDTLEIYCIKDPMYVCPNSDCQQRINKFVERLEAGYDPFP